MLKEEKLETTLYKQDIEKMDLPHAYDAIIIAIGFFQLLHSREKALEVLTQMKKFLNPGAFFHRHYSMVFAFFMELITLSNSQSFPSMCTGILCYAVLQRSHT
jgi:hypothetical protein